MGKFRVMLRSSWTVMAGGPSSGASRAPWGHQRGMAAVRESVEGALDAGIEILTLFAFSTENWQRPRSEVLALMGLLRRYVSKETQKLREQGCEVRVLGDVDALDASTRKSVDFITSETRRGNGPTSQFHDFLLGTGGDSEGVQADDRAGGFRGPFT